VSWRKFSIWDEDLSGRGGGGEEKQKRRAGNDGVFHISNIRGETLMQENSFGGKNAEGKAQKIKEGRKTVRAIIGGGEGEGVRKVKEGGGNGKQGMGGRGRFRSREGK